MQELPECPEHLWYTDTYPHPPKVVVRDWCVHCGEDKGNIVSPLAGGWNFTQHAIDRALDMAVDPDDIRRVLVNPEVRQVTYHPDHPEESFVWSAGRIALVVQPESKTVVTVLWRGTVYTRGDDSEPYRDN